MAATVTTYRRGATKGGAATIAPKQPDVVAIGDLVTQRRELINEVKRLKNELYSDALTQMVSRRGAAEYLKIIKNHKDGIGSVGVIAIDADHFKMVNDQFGHEAGDEFLRQLGFRTRKCVRGVHVAKKVAGNRGEKMPALKAALQEEGLPLDPEIRFGGEELMIVLPLGDIEKPYHILARIAQRICDALCDEPYDLHIEKEGKPVIISKTVSMGISILKSTELDAILNDANIASAISKLYGTADKGLYQAKDEGRARISMRLLNGVNQVIYAHPKAAGNANDGHKVKVSPLNLAA